ncbi:MAG TPA: beta-galactosidase, partial [Friedmanniella sp.]
MPAARVRTGGAEVVDRSGRPDRPPRPERHWPTDGLSFGGDYNPEQWTPDVWREDVRLMGEAGVNVVTLGVFSWGLLEPREGVLDWGWLDEVVGLLHDAGIAIDLATPTAAPPSWLLHARPEILPVDADGHPQHPGGRLGWCPSSPVFRAHALRITTALADRYGTHPAVRLWHVSNELGGGNARCWCDVSAAAFRRWLADRYGTVDAVNAAWGTAFWGHRFTDLAEVVPPRGHRDVAVPGMFLDYERFSSDELLAHYRAEAAVLRARSAVPVTTNFMVGVGPQVVDYAAWAREVDVVATDHYTLVRDPRRAQDLAFAGDRVRGLTADRAPWLLMEHSTGAPSWQERNRAKSPGEIARNALAHVAHGSDGALFFQWRASTAGTEQFHSAMLPHAGTDTRVWREVVELGAVLRRLSPVVTGSRVEPARVALLADDESGWALEQGLKPHRALRYAREPRLWHVSNELGGGNARCYCEVSADAFRGWLARRYGSVEAVNAAWGTAFWGHRFTDLAEIVPPRGHRDVAVPGMFLDYERFSSDELLAHYRAEAAVLRARSAVPVTTNFMVGVGPHVVDYAAWAPEVDVVATDHYTLVRDPRRAQELAFAGDRVRGLTADRRPWLLMEHSTGAPSWQERNRAKAPGEILRNALAHVAHGSDG